MQAMAAVAVSGTAAGTAAAQEDPRGTESPTATETGESVVVDLGTVTVADWSAESGTFSVELSAENPTSIKISDTGAMMNSMTSGSGSGAFEIPSRGFSLGSGRTTVEFDAEEFDGAYAVAVASTEAAALIRTDSVDAGSTTVKLGTAMFGGVSAAGGAGYLSYRQTKKSLEDEEEPNAERIL